MISQALLEPYLNSTTFMYISSTNSSRFKRSNVIKSHCQSSPWSTESKFQIATVTRPFRRSPPRGATRRRSPERVATRCGRPGTTGHDVNPPTRLSTSSPVQFPFPLLPPLACSSTATAAATSTSSCLLATAKTQTTSSPQLRRVLLYLLHP